MIIFIKIPNWYFVTYPAGARIELDKRRLSSQKTARKPAAKYANLKKTMQKSSAGEEAGRQEEVTHHPRCVVEQGLTLASVCYDGGPAI
jgi:hypothetical protein